jgi:hypothetical protein
MDALESVKLGWPVHAIELLEITGDLFVVIACESVAASR